MPTEQKGLVQVVNDRNALMNDLINENGVVAPSPSPSATPPPKSLGQKLAHLLGLGG